MLKKLIRHLKFLENYKIKMNKKYFGTDGIRGKVNGSKNKWRNVF